MSKYKCYRFTKIFFIQICLYMMSCLYWFLQVAHFEPETIHLFGDGIFPRISLNLPRHSVADEYEQLLCTARANLLKEANETVGNMLTEGLPESDVANDGSSLLVSQATVLSFHCASAMPMSFTFT